MGETDLHRNIMFAAIESLKLHYAGQRVYVSGNILLFYEPGNRRRHVSPDVMVVKGLEHRERDNYLVWQEGLAPNLVVEVTSDSTRDEDLEKKFEIYRDRVQVAEYFLFDPRGEYLRPALQGYRLEAGQYVPVEPVSGRLPSLELELSLEQYANQLRFYDPVRGGWLPTPQEAREEAEATWKRVEIDRQCAEDARQCAEDARQRAEDARQRADEARQLAEAESERLRQELAELRRRL